MTNTDKALRLLGVIAAWNVAVWSVGLAVIFLTELGSHQAAHLHGVPGAVAPVLLSAIGTPAIVALCLLVTWESE